MDKIDIYDVIESKIVGYGEIVVCLFEHCNLQCVFCPQDHNSVLGATRDEIMSKVKPIRNWIDNNPRKQAYKIHLMGGELFQDKWIDKDFLYIYDDFINNVECDILVQLLATSPFVTSKASILLIAASIYFSIVLLVKRISWT